MLTSTSLSVNQKGIAHLLLLIVLLAGIGLTVYLVGQKTQLFPWAASNPISGPIVSPSPLPSVIASVDSDGDGFFDSQEIFMGTDPNKACGLDAWPVDVNNDTAVNGGDMSFMVPYVQRTKTYNKRYDLNQDSKIDAADTAVIQVNFLKTCGSQPSPSSFPSSTPKPSPSPSTAPTNLICGVGVHSLVYSNNLSRYYTTYEPGVAALLRSGWRDAGYPFWAYNGPGVSGTVPVHSFYLRPGDATHQDRLLSTYQPGFAAMTNGGWVNEGPAFWAYNGPAIAKTVGVHSFVYRNTNSRYYTYDTAIFQALINQGWRDEGTVFWAYKNRADSCR